MADSKITALTALTAADPTLDMVPIVDVSDPAMAASGTTKRISINNILACSPTATLASATITGDLTVDTSTLKVDSTNNRVGIGTASPTSDLDIFRASGSGITSGISLRTAAGAGGDGSFIKWLGGSSSEKVAQIDGVLNGTDVGYLSFQCGNGADAMAEQYRIASNGVFDWRDGAGGTRMTLNSTGLGIGKASPGYKLVLAAASGNVMQFENTSDSDRGGRFTNTGTAGTGKFGITTTSSGYALSFGIDAVEKMLLDTNGNLILSSSATPATLTTNGQLTVNATSNTNLRFSYRGSDGTTRVANITLA
jgi:hypothetical protein